MKKQSKWTVLVWSDERIQIARDVPEKDVELVRHNMQTTIEAEETNWQAWPGHATVEVV